MSGETSSKGDSVTCYLCRLPRPKADTELARYRVASARPGGSVQGVSRYVRMCRVGFGCKQEPQVWPMVGDGEPEQNGSSRTVES